MLATATGPYLFWIASRAAGTSALLLSSATVCVGLLIGGRIVKGHRPELRVTHEALSLAALSALAVHGLSLLGDGYLHPRHAVAGVTATLFVLVFAVVYAQLATGHDPALVANARKHATAVHSEGSAA